MPVPMKHQLSRRRMENRPGETLARNAPVMTQARKVRMRQICSADNPAPSRWRTNILIVPHMAPAASTQALAFPAVIGLTPFRKLNFQDESGSHCPTLFQWL
jgi:hypothetical protein